MLKKPLLILCTLGLIACFSSCTEGSSSKQNAESEKLNAYFEDNYMERRNRYPEWMSYQGVKDRADEWNDGSDEMDKKELEYTKASLAYIRDSIQFDQLDPQSQVSYRLFEENCKESIEGFKYRFHNFPLNQMRGTHTSVPTFLININKIDSLKDAENYLARLSTVDKKFSYLFEGLEKRNEMGIVPPAFTFDKVIEACQNIISGYPFEEGKDCTILADFKGKLEKVDNIDADKKKALITEAETALKEVLKPQYEKIITEVQKIQAKANGNKGAWSLPNGKDFYEFELKATTTTDMTPQQIFDTGTREIARIHSEMKDIMKETKFKGDLNAFFDFMEKDEQFYYSNDDAGRDAYMKDCNAIIDGMRAKIDDLFNVKPKAALEVKRVEPFREKAAGKAFYNRPAPDGSRPGMYYANMYDMSQMPKYQMEALAYHEAIPGHHMQLAIAQELEGLPKFRKYGGNTAYIEGWGLYSEYIPKEIGFYEDPYSDFGRLAMELWRACRLVVDVGIHSKKWSREKSIAFYVDNTPNPYDDCVKMVERHYVMPSQATAYKIGMLKILSLREKAKTELGEDFDIKKFHDVVIKNGALPLNVLEEFVDDWIAEELES